MKGEYNFNLGNCKVKAKTTFSEKFVSCNNEEKNLLKFNILMYLLLPREIRGNYLGSVKKYFYDFKNSKHLEDMDFYHDLRLFERNIKHYELFSYSLFDDSLIIANLNNLKKNRILNIKKIEKIGSTNDLAKSINNAVDNYLLNYLFKYYSIVFSYVNEIEFISIYDYYKSNNCKSIEEVKTRNQENEFYNFKELLNKIPLNDDKRNLIIDTRNRIAHLNYKNIMNINSINKYHDELSIEDADEFANHKYDKLIKQAKHNFEKRLENLYTHIIVDKAKQRDYILYKNKKISIKQKLEKLNIDYLEKNNTNQKVIGKLNDLTTEYEINNNYQEMIEKLSDLTNEYKKSNNYQELIGKLNNILDSEKQTGDNIDIYGLILKKLLFDSFNEQLANLLGIKPKLLEEKNK